MTDEIFGTDGIRGRAGEDWLAAGAVCAVGRAAGEVLRDRDGALRAVTGHDGRRSGPELEAALAAGLAQAGYSVRSAGLITTPGLAIVARRFEFDFGAMMSASHNPASDNGIKIFGRGGTKLADAVEHAIERKLVGSELTAPDAPAPEVDPALARAYENLLVESVRGLDLGGCELVVDGANGAGSRIAPAVFERLGARVHAIACTPDGDNINDGCGATSTALLAREVLARNAELGVALDGDGDRCILIDSAGREVSGDGILTVTGRDLAERGLLASGRVVATVMSNRGLARALREKGVRVHTVGVGDRRVVEALREEAIELGGEQSGHIVFGQDHFYVGDGIYTALRVLEVVRRTGRTLSELALPYQPFPQILVNAPVARKPPLEGLPRVRDAVGAIERELGEDGRVLLRYSGTEPLVRVMVEGPDADWIRERAEELARLVPDEISRADDGTPA